MPAPESPSHEPVEDPAAGASQVRDRRLFHRGSWILVLGLVCFGAASLGLFWQTFPRGPRGVLRALTLLAVLVLLGGVVAPVVTRALRRRR